MPRDGSGQYTQPFPPVVEGTTIESTVYNGYTADITIDLNTPRPISSGGTGADNAADAMAALGGEGSKIEVLNYDSHNFTAGSFYSKASATNPPIAGHAFAGICYVAVVSGVATSDMFIEVRDRDEATQPGSLFVRQKKNGTWSGWLKAVGTSMGATPPAAPTDGVLWWDPTRGKLFIYYSDPDTAQWVEAVATPDMNPDDFVRIDAPQTLTETQKTQARDNIDAAPFDAMAYNGMQINGNAIVSQEFASVPQPFSTTGAYFCDGWKTYKSAPTFVGNVSTITGVWAIFPGMRNCIAVNVTTAQPSIGATESVQLYQHIEGYRIARLEWGTINARPLTIGFWTAHQRPGTYSVLVSNAAGNRSYVATYTQNVAATGEYKTITVPGDTTGTWNGDHTIGIMISFILACGTTYTAPAANTWYGATYIAAPGQVNAVASLSDVFRLTGLVVIPGVEAPSAERSPYIMRPIDQEIITCRRYYFKDDKIYVLGYSNAGQPAGQYYPFPTAMRAAPTLNYSGGSYTNASALSFSTGGYYGCRMHLTVTATGVGFFDNFTLLADARL